MRHKVSIGLAAVLLAATVFGPAGARAEDKLTEQEAHAIGVQAYLYFYSLVTMDLTRKQLTNVARPEGVHGPMNTFANIPEYPPADMKVVVRPNFDTLYSSVGASMRTTPAGNVPLHPGGVTAKSPASVPVVRQPGEAKTSVHMSSIGSR